MIHSLRLAVVPGFLLLCLVLGGASAAGLWANMALQLIAIAIIFWAVVVRRSSPMSRSGRALIALLVLMLLLIGAQLIPLPPGIWTALPGREPIANGFALLGRPLPWMPLSLAADRTLAAGLWLLPAIAVLLGILRLGSFKANWMAWVMAIIIMLSVAIGALQIVGGDNSPWYFYEITNYGSTTGFFANANHMATLMVATIPFLAALYLSARSKGHSTQKSSGLFVILGGALAVVLVGIAINGSLAGIGLTIPVVAATVLMLMSRRDKKLPAWSIAPVALLALGSVYLIYSTPFGSNNLTGQTVHVQESRYTSFTRSIAAAGDYMPVGSGIGSFVEVYRAKEDPAAVTTTYMNHVHSDLIEIALETGVPGLLLILLFLAWWVRRTLAAWRGPDPDYFARAATIASAAILAHSLVDYPLRTAAIGAVFAMCCALMAEPRARVRRRSESEGKTPAAKARHLSAD